MKNPPSPFKKKPQASAAAPRPARKPGGAALPSPSPPAGPPPGRRSAARAAAKLARLAETLTGDVGRLGEVVASLEGNNRSPTAREAAELLARIQRDYARAVAEKAVVAEGRRAQRQAAGLAVVRHLAEAGVDFAAALELARRGATAGDVLKALTTGAAAAKAAR